VIKRITFGSGGAAVDDDLVARGRRAVERCGDAPPAGRPVRVTLGIGIPNTATGESPHDLVVIEWFETDAGRAQFDRWAASVEDGSPLGAVMIGPDPAVVVAEEVVLRGAPWLDERWRRGGQELKHMAVARRAEGLEPEEFLRRWRSEAGRVPTANGTPASIPVEVRGRAYVQNHPRPRRSGEWPYDAINEVYLDSPDALERRIEWFRATLPAADRLLFRDPWSIAVRETVLFPVVRPLP
jgi:hypothetical protein